MSLLGIDLGAKSCRGLVISTEGKIWAQARRRYPLSEEGNGAELSVLSLWSSVRELISELSAKARHDPIRALSVASMGGAIVPLLPEGQTLASCLLESDARGELYLKELEKELLPIELFTITGSVPGPHYSLPKLCWLRDNQPELFARAWRFVPLASLVSHLLGGASTCDYSLASRTLFFDLQRKRWSGRILSACNIPRQKLPELAPAGKPVGTVSRRLAAELGLPGGVRIILGGHDLGCRALGAGVTRTGQAICNLGATMAISPTFETLPWSMPLMLGKGLGLEPHVIPGLLISSAYNRSGGRILRWFRDELAPLEKREAFRRGKDTYSLLLEEMPQEPSSLMVLPSFGETGPLYPRVNSGAILGLTLQTSRGELIKALLEGTLYFLAEAQEAYDQIGIPIHLYRAIGGGARSERWLQLAADILGRPIERTLSLETATLGAAILAGLGIGAFISHEEAVEALVKVEQRFEPDEQRQQFYAERLELYKTLYPLLREPLAKLNKKGGQDDRPSSGHQ
ncbi:MAG: hypothetical protein J7M05_11615 [Anaerolineae bacterium]|nr:hypothetical protein [Anaerolineae bacterium]